MTAAPTWADVIDASVQGQITGYEMGYAHGLYAAADQLDAEVLHEQAAKVIRGAIASMGVAQARATADQHPHATAPTTAPWEVPA